MMEKKFLLIVALLLFSGAASAAAAPIPPPDVCSQSSISNYWSNRFGNWQDIGAIGILLSFMVISVMYMLSQAFGRPGLAAWCRKEIFQVIVTAILLASIFGLINFACLEIKPSVFIKNVLPAEDDLFTYSLNYLQWLRDIVYSGYVLASLANGLFSMLTGTMIRQSPAGFGVNLRPLGGLSSLAHILSIGMSATLVGGIFTTIAQLRMLRAVQLFMFNIILPIGLVARCFEPFRRFGGALIALAIGMFVFYPFLLVLNAAVVKDVILPSADITTTFNAVGATDFSAASPLPSQQRAKDASQLTYFSTGTGTTDMNTYNNLFQTVWIFMTKTLIAGLFLPLLNFALLISFIRNISRHLGEEIDITNITRMI